MTQLRNADCGVRNKFTDAELEFLRLEAEKERAELMNMDLHPRYVLSAAMIEFAEDYNRGNTWNTPRADQFVKKIRKHISQRVETAGHGPSHTGAGPKSA
jgi:hypothetical protein